MYFLTLICLIIIDAIGTSHQLDNLDGMLYPRQSETREIYSLDGIWNFVASPENDLLVGFREKWYQKELKKSKNDGIILMPVPSSYNDITQDLKLRDHVGLVWYDRNFFVPKSWSNNTRVFLRFSSVSYAAQVWINGKLSMSHEIGHLPFEREVTHLLKYGENNLVTVACDNTLLNDTVPQGNVVELDTDFGKKLVQQYSFDFFNYAGIHRPVTLYTTPVDYINDITINTDIDGTTGIIDYDIKYKSQLNLTIFVKLLDKYDNEVVTNICNCTSGTLYVPNATFWWPYLLHTEPGYLYNLEIHLLNDDNEILDVYRQPVGIRIITWTNEKFFINNVPIYLHGFGRHEDSDIRGKGLDLPLIIRDYNLIKWIGANVYRTSHYPYADEIMDLADQNGIMIIDECPSVNTEMFSQVLLDKHKKSLSELIRRDKNRPSIIMWSIANEPTTQTEAAGVYFGYVADHVRSLDQTRPITMAIARGAYEDKAGKHLDIISFNRYNSWYSNTGHLDMIVNNVINEATSWHNKYNKPVLMSEYGADTVAGLHISPPYVWSEEFQVSMMSRHFYAFDTLRERGFFIGEFIWNFADFKTAQTYTRVGGNRKGIFTRNRQPKASAFHLRKRYLMLANQLYNVTLPADLFDYIAPKKSIHEEL